MGPLLASGSGYEYSNLNYDAMALIVERVSGMPYGEFVEQRIFEPVGMVDSTVGPDTSVDGFAQGHYHWLFLGYRPLEAWRPPGVVGGGFVASSAEDMARLLTVHTNGGMAQGRQIISEGSLAVLHEPRPYNDNTSLGYGGGWHVEPPGTDGTPKALAEYATLWHLGDWDGYWSTQWVTPEARVGVVILANGHDQTDLTSLGFVGQNVKHILTGEEIFEIPGPFGDFLTVWGKHLVLAVVLIQITLATAAKPLLGGKPVGTSGRVILGIATLVDLLALTVLVWVIPNQAPLTVTASLPDYWTLTLAMGAGVIWGIIRTILVIKPGRRPQPAHV
jgi:CubicO group peptidase (beta-lactamase class C family)